MQKPSDDRSPEPAPGDQGRRRFLSLLSAGSAGLLIGASSGRCQGRDEPEPATKPAPRSGQAASEQSPALAPAPSGRAPSTGDRRPPNLVLIVADDLGYADLGVQGCTDIRTPHLDALARGGVRCTDGYVTSPLCSPSRAGLLTGCYQQRFGHEFNTGKPRFALNNGIGLPLSETTLADALKGAGYKTGAVGKWHLGMREEFHPTRRGFDEFFGFLAGGRIYQGMVQNPINDLERNGTRVDEPGYLTDAFSREAVAFIQRNRQSPFFLYLAYNAPHVPLQATPDRLARAASIADPRRRTYAAMVSALDDGVGAVLRTLSEAGLEQHTLVIFMSDNGGALGRDGVGIDINGSRNTPLRDGKATLYEGGIRVPFVLRWPGVLPKGAVYENPVSSLDILPTALAAAGVARSAGRTLDGVDLGPYLTHKARGAPHDTLYFRLGQRRALRRGPFKLVRTGPGPAELYDLSQDLSETQDLAAQKPEVVRAMETALSRWEAGLAAPLWRPGARRGQGPRGPGRRRRRFQP